LKLKRAVYDLQDFVNAGFYGFPEKQGSKLGRQPLLSVKAGCFYENFKFKLKFAYCCVT
jgi:hypothetical protein